MQREDGGSPSAKMVRWNRTSWEPEDEDDYEAANAELKRRFAAWADDKGLEVERDGPEGLLHYKWAYVDRPPHPLETP